MKGIGGYVSGAAALVVLGGLCLIANGVETQIAAAQESLVIGDVVEEASLDSAERYLEYASYLPWVGSAPLNQVRARRAAREYWQQQYATVIPDQDTDPVAAVDPGNLELQLVVANAVFRAGQAGAKDRAAVRQMLEKGIEGYLTVLRNAQSRDDAASTHTAAYNYEYLVRLRSELEQGRMPPTAVDRDALGAPGEPTGKDLENDFKLYVPLDQGERDRGDAAKIGPRTRKG